MIKALKTSRSNRDFFTRGFRPNGEKTKRDLLFTTVALVYSMQVCANMNINFCQI